MRKRDIIDEAVASAQYCDAYRGYAKLLHGKVLCELDRYIDDGTDPSKTVYYTFE